MTLSALLLERQTPRGPSCSIGIYLDTLPPAERTEWTDALGNLRIQATTIARYAETVGAGIKPDAIRRHRNGQCLCPKT